MTKQPKPSCPFVAGGICQGTRCQLWAVLITEKETTGECSIHSLAISLRNLESTLTPAKGVTH